MNPHQISEYIDNLPLKKKLCKGYRSDEVYEVICTLSSMYNQILSEAYEENEGLRRRNEFLESGTPNRNFPTGHIDALSPENNVEKSGTKLQEEHPMQERKENVSMPEEKQQSDIADKELQKLKRGELLEILLEQSRENETLKLKLEESSKTIDELSRQLESRKIDIKEAGTIADASFKLNGVFEAAQKAAQQYLENLKDLYETESASFSKKEAETENKCAALVQATQERCDFMKEEMTKQCLEMETSVKRKCEEMEASVKAQCEEMRQAVEKECREREQAAEEKCRVLDEQAKTVVDKRWDEFAKRLEALYTSHEGLKDLVLTTKTV